MIFEKNKKNIIEVEEEWRNGGWKPH